MPIIQFPNENDGGGDEQPAPERIYDHPQPLPTPAKRERKPRLVVNNETKVKNRGLSKELIDYIADPHWKETNVLERQMGRMHYRLDQSIAGKVPLFVMCGPPGIAKSRETLMRLSQYSEEERLKWLALPKSERPERRTMLVEETEREEFRPMFFRATGRISHPQMHCRMYWSSYRREIFFIDDVSSLRDIRIQEMLQMASDLAAHRMVQYNYHAKNLPDDRVPVRYPMRGGIIACCNFNQKTEGEKITELFSQPVIDRAVTLHFSFEPMPLLQYVVRHGFVKRKAGPENQTKGLLRYVFQPDGEHDVETDPDDEGLGFMGTEYKPLYDKWWKENGRKDPSERAPQPERLGSEVEEAWKALMEVRNYFLINHERALISFRTLRKITRDRFEHPKDWEDIAEDHLRPRPPTEQKDQGDRPPAFAERPDSGGRRG